MKGWYIRDRDDEKVYICKCCGSRQDVPYNVCPDCGNVSDKECTKLQ